MCIGNETCQEKIQHIPKNIFTIHGLWPNDSDGRRIPGCNTGPKIDVQIQDEALKKRMETFWISYTGDNQVFWDHEYNSHGYCYMMKTSQTDPEVYFNTTLNLYDKLNLDDVILNTFGDKKGEMSFPHEDLKSRFDKILTGMNYEIECRKFKHKQYLQELRFSLDLDFNPNHSKISYDCNKSEEIIVMIE